MTDSCCDLPLEYIKRNNIKTVPLTFHIKNKVYDDDFGQSLDFKEFYKEISKGEMPTTSQVNVYKFEETFKRLILEGYSIVYIAFSPALSETYSNAIMTKKTILKENPSADITIIDSRSASIGQGLLVYYACEMLKQGKSKEEIVNWVENNKLKVNIWFSVDDLSHLKRGGRISAANAIIGTMLEIKPVLQVDNNGKLIVTKKIRGRVKSIRELALLLKNRIVKSENQTIFIGHCDCIEDANLLKSLICKEVKVKDVIINYTGAIIGAHVGPGMLSVAFIGQNR